MTAAALARRYAAALFDVVSRGGDFERAGRELSDVAEAIKTDDALRRAFESPAVPPAKKRAVLDALVAAAGGAGPEVTRLLGLIADRDRLSLLPEVAAAFEERSLALRRIVPAEIVTAMPLGEDRRATLARALGSAAGGDVRMTERVDPSIIGGMVARVGSVVFDGSVTRQLERLRERLLQQ
jgi:F-type H+-transporting ATPase subunit delta